LVEDRLELAGVVGRADRGLVRHRRRLDQVAAAQLDRVDAGDARGLVDEPLEHVVRLRPPGPAIGRRRDRIGERPARARRGWVCWMSYMPGRQRVKLRVWMLAPTEPI